MCIRDRCDGGAVLNSSSCPGVCVGGNTGLEIDCCEVCGDIDATNYSSVGICGDEEIFNDYNGNGEVDPGEEFSNAGLCIPSNVEGLVAQQSGLNNSGYAIGGASE